MSQIILWNSYGLGLNDYSFIGDGVKFFNIADYATVRPLGAHQLAFWLRENGYTVTVIDFCNMMETNTLVSITESHVDIDTIAIGVSSSFWITREEPAWVYPARYNLAARYPYLKWLLGGAREVNCRYDWIKFASYAEDSVLKFLSDQTTRKFDIKNSVTKYTDQDFIRPTEVLSMELGRGCQFRCKFCAYPLIGKKPGTYIRNMHTVREELIRMYGEFGVTRYNFIDDTVNEDEEKVENLARLAQSLPFELEWVGYCRADLIWARPHTIKTLRDSGLRSVFFGIESFHPEASKIIGKGWSGKRSKEFLLQLKDRWGDEVSMSLGLIVGLPSEPLESLDQHNEWLIENDIGRWAWTTLQVTRGNHMWTSEFDRNHEKYGIRFRDGSETEWYHNLCDKRTATAKMMDLSAKSRHAHRNCGFSLSDYCTTMGTPYKESMSVKLINIMTKDHANHMIQTCKSNVNRYVQNHLKRS